MRGPDVEFDVSENMANDEGGGNSNNPESTFDHLSVSSGVVCYTTPAAF